MAEFTWNIFFFFFLNYTGKCIRKGATENHPAMPRSAPGDPL